MGFSFGDALWLSTGFYRSPATSYQDLWRSQDRGKTWSLVAGDSAPSELVSEKMYEPYSRVIQFQGRLLAIGATVWESPDGISWRQVSIQGPGVPSEDTAVAQLGDVLVFVNTQTLQVHTSQDGLNWQQVSAWPGFTSRCGAAAFSARGKLWVMGGGSCAHAGFYTDVWSTSDGANWRQETALNALGAEEGVRVAWGERMWPCVVTRSDGVSWLIGGWTWPANSAGINLDDVWYSRDGVSWTALNIPAADGKTTAIAFEPRHAPTCYSDADGVLVAAGKGGPDKNNDNARVRNDVRKLLVPGASALK